MRVELQTAAGEPVRDLDIPEPNHFPPVLTLRERVYLFHHKSPRAMVFRESFAIGLEAFLPGQGMAFAEEDGGRRWERA